MDNTQFKSIIKNIVTKVLDRNGGEFARRIQKRNDTFWSGQEGKSIKAIRMQATDPLSKWQSIPYWQRLLSNKHNALEFAKMHGCRVPEVYWEGKDINHLHTLDLPKQYVIKPTIGAGCKMVYLMHKGINLMDKQPYSKAQIVAKLAVAQQSDPRLEFIVEEFVRTEKREYKIPVDYKIHTFNGQIAFIHLINRLSPCTGSSTFYDENWNQLNYIQTCYPEGKYQNPPACLNEMLEYARNLSKAYEIFVRIDFYATDKGAVFGEFTPTPAMGRTYKTEGEKILLDYWDKYCNGMI